VNLVHQEAGPTAAKRYTMESVLLATKQQAAISSDQPWSGFVLKLPAGQMTVNEYE
jgi:hypothetical protein